MRGIFHIGFLLLLAGAGLAQQPAGTGAPSFGEDRQALVMGNNQHRRVPLTNPVNDARAVDAALTRLGFHVTLLTDATYAEMERGIKTFLNEIKPDAVAIVYFAGHGVELEGNNYLIPIDLDADDDVEVKDKAIGVNGLLRRLEGSRAKVRLLILDACRNNPYEKLRSLSTGGLAHTSAVRGSYIAFSTQPGEVALDGPAPGKGGRTSGPADPAAGKPVAGNSVFAAALVKELENGQPGWTIDELFTHVRQRVDGATGGKQVPFSNSGLIGEWYPFGLPTLPEPDDLDIKNSSEAVENALRRMAKGEYDEARRSLDSAIRYNRNNSLAFLYRGILSGIEGKQTDESNDLSEAIRLDPSNYLAYLNRGMALRGVGRCYEAMADFDQAAAKAPELAEVYRYRAACQTENGMLDQAKADLAKAAALESNPR